MAKKWKGKDGCVGYLFGMHVFCCCQRKLRLNLLIGYLTKKQNELILSQYISVLVWQWIQKGWTYT